MSDFMKVFPGPLKKASFSLSHILYFALFAGDAVYNVRALASNIVFANVGSLGDFTGNSTRFVQVVAVYAIGFVAYIFG